MIYHALDHAADCTLSKSSLVTLTVHLLCAPIPFFHSCFSHCIDGPQPPSTIDFCLHVSHRQSFPDFRSHVDSFSSRSGIVPVMFTSGCCTRHSITATEFIPIRFVSVPTLQSCQFLVASTTISLSTILVTDPNHSMTNQVSCHSLQ